MDFALTARIPAMAINANLGVSVVAASGPLVAMREEQHRITRPAIGCGLCRKGGLEMRKGLLTSMGLAGLFAASPVQGTVAAPIVPSTTATTLHGPLLEQVYYYHGRYYPYRYNNRYYAHRVYRHGHWHYY
jgi:hypothetical protein